MIYQSRYRVIAYLGSEIRYDLFGNQWLLAIIYKSKKNR